MPLLVELGRIDAETSVLDVGCGTGGFARAIAESTGARVIGLERSPRFLEHARRLPGTSVGRVEWLEADAEELPLAEASVDRVVLSLVLHQLRSPRRAVAEARRVLRPEGIVLVRTIAPEDVGRRVPERYLPSMAAADTGRMPAVDTVERWLREAGFESVERQRHARNKPLELESEERELLVEVRSRYPFVDRDELDEGLRRMRADARAAGAGWVDPRPTWFLRATRPRAAPRGG